MSSSSESPTLTSPLSLDSARRRCTIELTKALREEWTGVFSALMGMGKSSGIPPAVAETGKTATVLVGLGHHQELYQNYQKWSGEAGIIADRIPSSSADCPSFNNALQRDYNRGVSPATVHEKRNLSCMPGCPYLEGIRQINENPSSYDLLIGHYSHAHFPKAIVGRSVFIDEFDGNAFESEVNQEWVSHYLGSIEALPLGSLTGLIESRTEPELRREVSRYFEDNGLTPSEGELLRDTDLWSIAAVAVWGLLTARDLGNGWEIASFHEFDVTRELDDMVNWYRVARNRDNGRIFVLQVPPLHAARNVIGLDGTPTMELWGTVVPELLDKRQVLSDEERRAYITDALNHEYILTTNHTKPYSPKPSQIKNRVNVANDLALFEGIAHHEGERPGLTTTKKAKIEVYDNHDIDSLVDGVETFPVLGSNKFESKRVGANVGYQHFGDGFIQKWGAYAGVAVQPDHSGSRADYGEFGNKVFNHFRNQTLQATMRFGRDGNGATVYVHTDTLPEWVPIAREATVYELANSNSRFSEVVEAACACETLTVGDLPLPDGTARKWLKRLYDGGYVDTDGRTTEGAVLWRNIGIDESEHGILVLD